MTAKWIHPMEEGRAEEKPDGGKEMRELQRESEESDASAVSTQFFSPPSPGFPPLSPAPPPSKLTKKKTSREEKRAGICGKTIIPPVPNSFWHCQSRGATFFDKLQLIRPVTALYSTAS